MRRAGAAVGGSSRSLVSVGTVECLGTDPEGTTKSSRSNPNFEGLRASLGYFLPASVKANEYTVGYLRETPREAGVSGRQTDRRAELPAAVQHLQLFCMDRF